LGIGLAIIFSRIGKVKFAKYALIIGFIGGVWAALNGMHIQIFSYRMSLLTMSLFPAYAAPPDFLFTFIGIIANALYLSISISFLLILIFNFVSRGMGLQIFICIIATVVIAVMNYIYWFISPMESWLAHAWELLDPSSEFFTGMIVWLIRHYTGIIVSWTWTVIQILIVLRLIKLKRIETAE